MKRCRGAFAVAGVVMLLALALFGAVAQPAAGQVVGPVGGVVGGNGIEGRVPGMRVHTGGHTGTASCDWYTIDQVNNSPELMALVPGDDQQIKIFAWERFYGETRSATVADAKQNVPGLLDAVLLLRHCKTGPVVASWIVIPILNIGPIAALFPGDLVRKYLKPPVLHYEKLDPEFGWAYAQVPLDIRTTPLRWRPYTVTAENGPDVPPQFYRWVTVTAVPKTFTFAPEDGSHRITCAGSEPIAPFSGANPGPCSVVFKHESSTAANGFSFAVRGEITWSITYTSSAGPGVLPDITLGTDGNIQVAAMKALVRCVGSGVGRGGC